MAENTRVPLRVKYINKDTPFQAPFEEGVLYFVEAQHTIYKDGIVPFGGISNVTFIEDGNTTEIRFSTDGSDEGDAGKLVVSNSNLIELVNSIKDRLEQLEDDVQDLDYTTSSIMNLDKVAPKSTPYTLSEAIDYVATNVDSKHTKNIGVLFNDGDDAKIYIYSKKSLPLDDVKAWKEIQVGFGKEVQKYNSFARFPVVGKPEILYIDEANDELFYWDDDAIQYKQIGFNPLNIKFIDSNFN